MGAFTYVDIFLTKGIEYLLVIDFLLIFILFWKALSVSAEEVQKRGVEAEYRGVVENGKGDRETKLFGPHWTWKWEIIKG